MYACVYVRTYKCVMLVVHTFTKVGVSICTQFICEIFESMQYANIFRFLHLVHSNIDDLMLLNKYWPSETT